MPRINRILETALYCDDLDKAQSFYTGLFGFPVLLANERIRALDVAGVSVLLLFQRGLSREALQLDAGLIPGHETNGSAHFAFAISASEYAGWKDTLLQSGVAIESEVRWPAGGLSLYFRDPEGHSVELATPGIWASY